jgi:precorrin-6B methylase 1
VCLVSTPMGNPGDITLRAIEMLRTCDVIAAEDTRKCQLLLRALGLAEDTRRTKLMSHHEHNSEESIPNIIAHAKRGALVAVVSDAGTPTINDPGQKLAHACVQQGIALSIAPGVSAPIAAMSLSGLLCSEWLYVGFLPRTSSKLRRKLSELAREERAIVTTHLAANSPSFWAGSLMQGGSASEKTTKLPYESGCKFCWRTACRRRAAQRYYRRSSSARAAQSTRPRWHCNRPKPQHQAIDVLG